jgi:hypothetical protein
MDQLTTYGLALIPLAIAGVLIALYLRSAGRKGAGKAEKHAYQGVVKKDWVLTGRIDFATHEGEGGGADAPAEFKLLVEERRIVESIAGNENLEIQWRLASLKEAKVVIAHYHKYVAEHGLIKSVNEEQAAAAAAAAAPATPAAPDATAAAPAPAAPTTPTTPTTPAEATVAPPAEPVARVLSGT